MAKKSKASEGYRFTTGVDLADGSRFEVGDAVPDTLTKTEFDALVELDAIERVEAE